jgi:hypothetical protein
MLCARSVGQRGCDMEAWFTKMVVEMESEEAFIIVKALENELKRIELGEDEVPGYEARVRALYDHFSEMKFQQ